MVKCFIEEVSGKISVNQYIGQSIAIYAAAPREHLGGLCLAQGHLVVVLSVERALDIHFPPPTIPAGPRIELATFGLLGRLSNH